MHLSSQCIRQLTLPPASLLVSDEAVMVAMQPAGIIQEMQNLAGDCLHGAHGVFRHRLLKLENVFRTSSWLGAPVMFSSCCAHEAHTLTSKERQPSRKLEAVSRSQWELYAKEGKTAASFALGAAELGNFIKTYPGVWKEVKNEAFVIKIASGSAWTSLN